MSVTVVGCISFDTIDAPGREAQHALGGSALYAALAASISTGTRIVAAVGGDCSEATLSPIRDRGIDLNEVQRLGGRTLRWHGQYWGEKLQERRTVSLDEGVMAELNLEEIEIGTSDVLYLATAHPKHQRCAAEGGSYRLLALDTIDSYVAEFPDELLSLLPKVDLLFLNESEAKSLAGRTETAAAAEVLLKYGPTLVCVKRAHNGASLFAANYVISCPAFGQTTVVDPTGAGDGFAGAFLGHLDASGADCADKGLCEEALIFATAVASSIVEEVGPVGLLKLTDEKIEARQEAIRAEIS
jgi:Sugar kinases, ribokinase family